MSKDTETAKLIENSENEFIKNAIGYSICILQYIILDEDETPKPVEEAGYHLHFLYSYDKENDILDILCLDTLDNLSIVDYEKNNKTDKERKTARVETIGYIFDIFVTRSVNVYNNKMTINQLLDLEASSKMWSAYKTIKKEGYKSGLMKFKNDKSLTIKPTKKPLVYRRADTREEIKAEMEQEYYDEERVPKALAG